MSATTLTRPAVAADAPANRGPAAPEAPVIAARTADWHAANRQYLTGAMAVLRAHLQRAADQKREPGTPGSPSSPVAAVPREPEWVLPAPPALERLRSLFGLTRFERDVLLLCAAVEFDARFAPLCAAAQGDPQRAHPTFSLALATLPGAHWSALAPAGPLRRWRLVEVGSGPSLALSPLRIDERVLHSLAGVQHTDERLATLLEPAQPLDTLLPSQRSLAAQVAAVWARASGGVSGGASGGAGTPGMPVVQLCGDEPAARRAIAAAACAALGLNLAVLAAESLPLSAGELWTLVRLWEREAALSGSALLLDCDGLDGADLDRARTGVVARFVERTGGLLLVCSRERQRSIRRTTVTFDVGKPAAPEQRDAWRSVLGSAAQGLNGHLDSIVAQFNLGGQAIRSAGADALGRIAATSEPEPAAIERALWDACRLQARPRLEDLAQRIEPAASWDDLVLPEAQRQVLRQVATHVRHRATVYERWGFAGKGARGLGISALFAGASGTGKTMAAEVLAGELRLDLYRIDLSSTVSKYIGETEKNLRQIFDAAEEGGAILLFDEADALFGKRSEVKDSHDRYANIEVGYLLQRMEAYRGLAILTTNLKNSLDPAFLRRIRFVVQFPFPDAAQRAEIWRHAFPARTPVEGLDVACLARLNVAGGNIRNIVLNAAFLAAEADEPVRMRHLLHAARAEYAKLEKPLTEAEVGAWPTDEDAGADHAPAMKG